MSIRKKPHSALTKVVTARFSLDWYKFANSAFRITDEPLSFKGAKKGVRTELLFNL